MARYIIVDGTGRILNAIEWDGAQPYSPPAGCILVRHDTARHGVDRYAGGAVQPNADPRHVAIQAERAREAEASARHDALIERLAKGEADGRDVQEALAKVLGADGALDR